MFRLLSNKNINHKIRIPFPIVDIYYFQWNQKTPTKIHDHAKYGCLLLLLKGSIIEKIYDKNNFTLKNENIYRYPRISYINDNIGYHSIQPIEKSSSIHIYYPKNHITKNYKKKIV